MIALSNRQKGTLCIILSAFCFAWMNAFVRLAGDLPFIQKSFFRNLVALTFALVMLLRQKGKFLPRKGPLPYLLIRAAAGTTGILCNFYAIDHLALSDASILNKMSPFFVILCSWLILKEKLTWQQGMIVLGAVGTGFSSCSGILRCDPGGKTRFCRGECADPVPRRRYRGHVCRSGLYAGAGAGTAGAERGICGAVFLRIFLSGDAAVSAACL